MLAKSFKPTSSFIAKAVLNQKFAFRALQTVKENDLDTTSHVHFRKSNRPHPLNVKVIPTREEEIKMGDHTGRQQNHIWTKDELKEKMATLYHYEPKSFMDHVMNKIMFGCYHTFNFVTGYKADNPSVQSMQWRLIILESIAGVPGFVAAGFRHFRSLRRIQRDHGWIATLLEEAENERMHLLLCINMFNASLVTRTTVVLAQWVMTPVLMGIYLVYPQAMHRFVGYLEETACYTYVNTIKHIETPGTELNKAWATTPAPAMAIGYYHLPNDALWVDTLKCMMADECHHRDVNHTFAELGNQDPNPFVEMHKENAAIAWRLNQAGEPAWVSPEKPAAPEDSASSAAAAAPTEVKFEKVKSSVL